jgi:hypothetical protein
MDFKDIRVAGAWIIDISPLRCTRGAIFDVASESCPAPFQGRAKRGARDLCTPQWFRGDGIRSALRPVLELRADMISFMESVG